MTRISPKQVASLFEPQIILIKPQKRKQPELSPASLDIKRIEEKERSQKSRARRRRRRSAARRGRAGPR